MGTRQARWSLLTKAGEGFVETDYISGKAAGTYAYMPVDATTMTLKAVNVKAGQLTSLRSGSGELLAEGRINQRVAPPIWSGSDNTGWPRTHVSRGRRLKRRPDPFLSYGIRTVAKPRLRVVVGYDLRPNVRVAYSSARPSDVSRSAHGR